MCVGAELHISHRFLSIFVGVSSHPLPMLERFTDHNITDLVFT